LGNNDSNGFETTIKILILGSGFSGVTVLRELQKSFKHSSRISITLVSRQNYFLFTPMLPEACTGMVEIRHIATAMRDFLNISKTTLTTFYEANVEKIDLCNKKITISSKIGKYPAQSNFNMNLSYDYLVIALGSKTNFFGMNNIERYSFTMKDLTDTIAIRNHIIGMLEQAELERANEEERRRLLTFVVVGGGFSGVEIAGELNDLIRESIRAYYHELDEKEAKVILVHSKDKILPEIGEELGEYALQQLKQNGVNVILNSHATDIRENNLIELEKGKMTIPARTLIWTAGVKPEDIVEKIPCPHDKSGRIKVNYYLQISNDDAVYSIGDCASVIDPHNLKPYAPTAQIATRQAKVVARNIQHQIKHNGRGMVTFNYKPKGMMAEIGKRTAVAKIFGIKLHGFAAWWLWRTFYWMNLPTASKKIRVMTDWTIDLMFDRDVTVIHRSKQDYHANTTANDSFLETT
jgi:NADH:ubiquinone reductase (H+-translocating)